MITLIESCFSFMYNRIKYSVVFSDNAKEWRIYHPTTPEKCLGVYPWNGIKCYPTADDAETVLIEFLNIED